MDGILDQLEDYETRPGDHSANPRNAGKHKAFCKKGHEYTEANTIWRFNGKNRARRCRECERQRKSGTRNRPL